MRSGTIELGSGRWHWTLLPQWTGATIVFQHRDRVHDEMRSWTPHREIEPEEAQELGAEALERTWMDVDGLKWRLSLELPSDWQRGARGSEDRDAMWLLFKRGGLRRSVQMPAGRRLGDLSHVELKRLLEEAYSSGSELHT